LPFILRRIGENLGEWNHWKSDVGSYLRVSFMACNTSVILPLRRPDASSNEKECEQAFEK
jgi:hypothetical protein